MFNFTIFLPSSWGDETRNSSSSLLFHKNLTEEETCRFFRGGEGYAGVCFYSRKESTVSVYVIVNPAGGVWNCLLEILSFSVFFGFSILNQIISGQLHRQRKLFSAGYTSYKCMDFWLDLVTDGVSNASLVQSALALFHQRVHKMMCMPTIHHFHCIFTSENVFLPVI